MAHEHSVIDSDALFTVGPLTMEITANGDVKALRQGDHAAEKYTFSMPRFVEGHDMTLCNVVEVHYDNINVNSSTRTTTTNSSYDAVDDFGIAGDDEGKVSFSWLVKADATQLSGSLNFSIRFACVAEDGSIDYQKFTKAFKSITVDERIYNKDKIVTENIDRLEEWRVELTKLIASNSVTPKQIALAVSEYFNENPTATIGTVELLADKWTGENNLYSQVVEIEGVTPNSQVDLTPSVEQLTAFYEKDLTLVTENENGVVTVYAIGQKPTNDYTVQVTITEVSV